MSGVLIVDDEELSRIAMRKLLGRLFPGVLVVGEAENGRIAVELAAALSPDIVLMDIKIPAINGLDAASLVLRAAPETAVIIVSAYDNFSFAQRALNMGLAGYLLKPIREDEFASVFGAALGRPSGRRHPAQPGTASFPEAGEAAAPPLRTRIEAAIAACPLPELGLEAAARRLGMSPQHLSRVFKLAFGLKFVDYVAARKIEAAKAMLREESLTVEELGRRIGWTDQGHLSRVFRERTGLTPKAYARQCRAGDCLTRGGDRDPGASA
ncbi:MAG: response regulator [Treponema sp.]|nr:response regulator [Treponema sp.]